MKYQTSFTNPRRRCGALPAFTLTELMVVIVILMVLMSIAFPMVMGGAYKAKVAQSVSRLREVGLANIHYSQDNNGQVCGLGKQTMPRFGRPNHHEGIMWQIAAYGGAGMTGQRGKTLTWSDVVKSLQRLHHPHLDESITWGPEASRWSVAINTSFSNWPGKDAQGNLQESMYPRVSAVSNPSATIYACSGIWNVKAEDASDRAFLELPEGAPRNGPYFTKSQQLPVIFLDGSAGLERFPVSKTLFDLKHSRH